ncbi:MAG: type IX secretion system membrane protein PorP/SprF [Bacteroidales bacterium]|nr:type IX secretion system membrane protein PorP/SprF [Bacteroidales bacterium]
MARRKLILLLLIITPVTRLTGQEETSELTRISLVYPVYSQYLHNGLLINPAYAGTREALSFFASGRMQWAGIDGAPISQTVSLHTLLKNNHVGLGFSGQFFKYGFTRATSVYADYAYHIMLGKSRLSMGLRTGFDMSNTDYSGIVLINPNDPVFISNDKPYFLPNVGTGIYFSSKNFFIGAAIPAFLSYLKSSSGEISFDTFTNFDMLLTAGALISFSPAFRIKPSVFIDYPVQENGEVRFDMNCNFILFDFLWLGASWRAYEEVAVGILQLQITPKIMFGYSYDYPMGKMSTYSKGSHEIIFRYEFGYKVSAANPRYF